MSYKDPHLDHRRAQEEDHLSKTDLSDPMSSLVSVEVNVMDACNRTCVFCPHGNPSSYPNMPKWRMLPEVSDKIGRDLSEINYKGRISFSGYGEPFMNKGLGNHIKIFRMLLPNSTIEINTNGDALNPKRIIDIFESGLTYLYVNMYDGEHQEQYFHRMFIEANIEYEQYKLRPHWEIGDYGLTLNNRSGMVESIGNRPEPWMGKACYYPFYKMFVDWNGDVIFCANDWGRIIKVGNILKEHVKDIWLSDQMKEIRLRLAKGDRSHKPCDTCNVHGTLHGEHSFNVLMKHYDGV